LTLLPLLILKSEHCFLFSLLTVHLIVQNFPVIRGLQPISNPSSSSVYLHVAETVLLQLAQQISESGVCQNIFSHARVVFPLIPEL
jgi:hypothetical protein